MSSFDFGKSTITKYRAGTSGDQYIDISESKKVINGTILLSEIPDFDNKVKIPNMFEVPRTNNSSLKDKEYIVDYNEGIISFSNSAEGLTLSLTYKGRGNHYVSSARIWTQEQDGEVLETLKDIVDKSSSSLEKISELSNLMKDTKQATINANDKATLADTKATYAQTQGDYAKSQGALANTASTLANTAKDNANTATSLANSATTAANNARDNANVKATYAQQQGDYALGVADSLVHKGIYNASTAYVVRNIIYYNGSTYMCISNTTGNLPTNTSYWRKLTNMNWLGTYSTSTTYNFGDIVVDSLNQTLYMCILDGTLNKALTTVVNWTTLVSVASAISNANTATTQANTARDNANTATTSANNAATSANTKATFAQTQGDYAKAQGDYAKDKAEKAIEVGTSLINRGTYSNTLAYKPLNIVVYDSGVYQNIVQSTGILPTNSSYWQLLMQTSTSVTWDTISGKPEVESHIANKSNPHAVTASQVGSYSKEEATANFAPISHNHTAIDLPNNLETITGAQAKATSAETKANTYTDNKVSAQVGTLSNLLTSKKTNTVEAINELFTSLGDGKNNVRAAIIEKGGTVAGTSPNSFKELTDGIKTLSSSINGQLNEIIPFAETINTNDPVSIKISPIALSKIPNPDILPTGNANDVAFSNDGNYLCVAHSTSPYITIYKKNGSNFIKLADPTDLPLASVTDVAFSPDGVYLSIAESMSYSATIYKRTGDTFTKLTNKASVSSFIMDLSFSPDGNYLGVATYQSPYISIHKRSGDTFTRLANPSALPSGQCNCISFSSDNNYVAVGQSTAPYLSIYKRSGDTLTKITNPSILPTDTCFGVAFSNDNKFLAFASSSSPYIIIYKRDGDTFTKIANPIDIPDGTCYSVDFSSDSNYLGVSLNSFPYFTRYKITGDTFTKLSDPSTLPTSGCNSTSFSLILTF
ncbi:WD40 repeat domain-containing protein [Paenibacillus pini]|uniref:Chitin-binding type-3 domain-containing protein n=1 Tax=Paenibacillus pini JCM 16418 TaxID=1236976 RepID=W7YSI1_9BACL|nr:hypothetical protein [Paenibacillus pini]GAF07581.1 hypothetical protein JCM16418_1607 [Paenibacillus pini JCM 16418]